MLGDAGAYVPHSIVIALASTSTSYPARVGRLPVANSGALPSRFRVVSNQIPTSDQPEWGTLSAESFRPSPFASRYIYCAFNEEGDESPRARRRQAVTVCPTP